MSTPNCRRPHLLRRLARSVRQRGYPIQFLARRYIHQIGARFGGLMPPQVACLDLGAGVAPYRADIERCFDVGLYIAFDIAASDATTLIGDATRLPLRTASTGLVVSMDTLQHIPDTGSVFDEIRRIVAPGGLVILSFPFTYGECDVVDFHRWSMQGMESELTRRGFEILEASRRGGSFFALACALQWGVQHVIPGGRTSWRHAATPWTVLRSLLVQVLSLPTAVISWLALLLDAFLPTSGLYMGGLIVARQSSGGFGIVPA